MGNRRFDSFLEIYKGISSGDRVLVTIEAMKIFRSLRWFFFLAVATAAGFLISSLHAASPEEQAVLEPVMAMFDGMAKRDADAIKKPLLTGGAMVLMWNGKPTQMTFAAFA